MKIPPAPDDSKLEAPPAVACFTFDNMAEAAEVGSGERSGPRPPGEDPSLAVGYPRLYERLAGHGVRATFFVEGWNGEHHPEAVAEVVSSGHELGMHGWVHERWADLHPDAEAILARRATEALEQAAGVRPRGFRAPGGARGPNTGALLASLGYRYDASLGESRAGELLPSGLVQVPFRWSHVDGFHYLAPEAASPSDLRDRWLASLERTARAGGLFLVICHAFLTGVDRARLAALDAVLAAAVADPRISLRTVGEVADGLQARLQPPNPGP
jgi:peptidoglycan/xylan/chitin deacetylase (PgdA/CDA1 family)